MLDWTSSGMFVAVDSSHSSLHKKWCIFKAYPWRNIMVEQTVDWKSASVTADFTAESILQGICFPVDC